MTRAAKTLAAAALAAAAACGPSKGPSQETRTETMTTSRQFAVLYSQWQKHMDDPRLAISSRPSDMIDCEPYRKIIALGEPALPLVIAKMREGDASGWKEGQFFLWHAARRISGVDLPEDPGQQEMARRYIRWYDESDRRR